MTASIAALAAELTALLGPDSVSIDDGDLDRASADGSWLSPVISEQLPLGRAELVAFPADAPAIAATVAAAVRHGVPITPRGKGTGNYGQAIPMARRPRPRHVARPHDRTRSATARSPPTPGRRSSSSSGPPTPPASRS